MKKSASAQQPHICIASDHAGYALKTKLIADLEARGYEVEDLGTNSDKAVDYPLYAQKAAKHLLARSGGLGVLCCGSGQGMAMAANRFQKIRAAVCGTSALAALARKHNDANVLCLAARFLSVKEAKKILNTFLETTFEGGRHHLRVRDIDARTIKQAEVPC